MEIVLAAIAGYLFAQLMTRPHRRALAFAERMMEQDQAETVRTLTQRWDSLFGSGPIHLRVEGGTIHVDRVSATCPGPHGAEIDAHAVEARQHLARYVADRIVGTRFSRITIDQ